MIDLRYSAITDPVPQFVVDQINPAAKTINVYPDRQYSELKKILAKDAKTCPECIFVGNGLDDVIDQLSRYFSCPFLIPTPAFSEFARAAKRNKRQSLSVPCLFGGKLDLEPLLNRADLKNSVVWLANPNNPAGAEYDSEQIKLLSKKAKALILDEAYYEFSETARYIDFSLNENIIRLRTFSKALGLAGIRLGYAIAPKKTIDELEKLRPLFVLNTFAAQAGLLLPKLRELIPQRINKIKINRIFFQRRLDSLGYRYIPSTTNFLLVDFVDGKNAKKALEFLGKNNILLLPPDDEEFDGLDEKYIRFVIGTKDEMAFVADVLAKLQKGE